MASLAVRREIAPGECGTFTFLLSWHFPNRIGWQRRSERIGNYYTTLYAGCLGSSCSMPLPFCLISRHVADALLKIS